MEFSGAGLSGAARRRGRRRRRRRRRGRWPGEPPRVSPWRRRGRSRARGGARGGPRGTRGGTWPCGARGGGWLRRPGGRRRRTSNREEVCAGLGGRWRRLRRALVRADPVEARGGLAVLARVEDVYWEHRGAPRVRGGERLVVVGAEVSADPHEADLPGGAAGLRGLGAADGVLELRLRRGGRGGAQGGERRGHGRRGSCGGVRACGSGWTRPLRRRRAPGGPAGMRAHHALADGGSGGSAAAAHHSCRGANLGGRNRGREANDASKRGEACAEHGVCRILNDQCCSMRAADVSTLKARSGPTTIKMDAPGACPSSD